MAPPTLSRIDRRAHEALIAFAADFHLAEHRHFEAVIAALRTINVAEPSEIDLQLWAAVQDELAPLITYHERYPFPVVPTLGEQPIKTGLRQLADEQPITLTTEELSRSGLLPGPTGEGKTTLAMHLCQGARDAGIHVIIIDPKKDDGFRQLVASDRDFFILEPRTPLNLIARDDSLTLEEHEALLIDVGAATLYAGEDYKAIMSIAYRRAFQECAQPTMTQVLRIITQLSGKGETYKFRDAQRGAQLRHERLIARYPGLHTEGGAPLSALFNHSLYLPLTTVTEVEDFLVTYLLRRLYHFHRRNG